MRTPAEIAADRADPRYDRPANYQEMVEAARQAADAARAAGAGPDAVKRSAQTAALQVAGLRPLDDWNDRADLD